MSNGFVFMAYTHSPLHAGIGQTMGMVDLPVQREKHTGYPCVYSSGLKGSLRSWFEKKYKDFDIKYKKFFGDEDASAAAGSAIFTDLKLLFFPVRSSQGTFKWVTCNRVLKRFEKDCKIADVKTSLPELNTLKICEPVPKNIDPVNHLLLEDYVFTMPDSEEKKASKDIIEGIQSENVYKIDDDVFDYFVTYSTQVIARNELDKVKTSKNLWYEEALPADTVLYSFIKPSIVNNSNPDDLKTGMMDKIIQIGGGETIGYGITKIHILEEAKNGSGTKQS